MSTTSTDAVELAIEVVVGKLLDLTMLAIPGGMERTEDEYQRLFSAAGLRIARIVPTAHEISDKVVTYDVARLMPGAKQVSCYGFGAAMIVRM